MRNRSQVHAYIKDADLGLHFLDMQCFQNIRRISIDKDTKVTNAATFTLQREDHTVGNLVRM